MVESVEFIESTQLVGSVGAVASVWLAGALVSSLAKRLEAWSWNAFKWFVESVGPIDLSKGLARTEEDVDRLVHEARR